LAQNLIFAEALLNVNDPSDKALFAVNMS